MVLIYISRFFSIDLATGECITITDDSKIFIDAKQYQDIYGYVEIEMFLNGDRNSPVTLATDEYFVMGDNRNVSADSQSKEIGSIHKSEILGKIMKYIDFI